MSQEDLATVSSILLRAAISSTVESDGTLILRERDYEKTLGLLSGRIDFSPSEPLGLYGRWIRLKYRYVTAALAIILSFAVAFLSNIVWDIRVEGNTTLTDGAVIISLSEVGFRVGDLWPQVNRSRIESDFLSSNPAVSWININRRGTVAYVKLLEGDPGEEKDEPIVRPSNIVASADCVIEEITVRRGIPAVKVGDAVKKGDILVFGALPAEAGGGFCAAEATVIGRISDTVGVQVERNSTKKIYLDRKLYSKDLKIFKFSLNIFKLYGNLTKECDIIEDEKAYSLFGRCTLPLSVRSVYLVESRDQPISYTDEELVNIAKSRLDSLTAALLSGADLLRITSEGSFTDQGYEISSRVVYLSEVGVREEIQIE